MHMHTPSHQSTRPHIYQNLSRSSQGMIVKLIAIAVRLPRFCIKHCASSVAYKRYNRPFNWFRDRWWSRQLVQKSPVLAGFWDHRLCILYIKITLRSLLEESFHLLIEWLRIRMNFHVFFVLLKFIYYSMLYKYHKISIFSLSFDMKNFLIITIDIVVINLFFKTSH